MFKNHGTKIIGVAMGVLGTLMTLTPEQLTGLLGTRGAGIAVSLGALATILRGFQNSGTLPGGKE